MDPLLAEVAEEFDLGTPIRVDATPYGWDQVVRLTTERGQYVVKPARQAWQIALYHRVECTLNARGVRQARLFLTSKGEPVGSTGHYVQELLPGEALEQADAVRSLALFGHLATYDAALREVAVSDELLAEDTVWTRVVSPDWLLDHLPTLVERAGLAWLDRASVDAALAVLAEARAAIQRLPRQLVHGDLGPDNVLYDGANLVAIIDFTPFYESRLFSVCTALYWFHVHPGRSGGVDADVAAYDDLERELLGPMLVREALRRLATPLAAAERSGDPLNEPPLRRRYDALLRLLR